uniref:hypothetical protein n=1 Tax=Thiolapillus sp. TaxID=2017437 RepID=UPI003AF7E166
GKTGVDSWALTFNVLIKPLVSDDARYNGLDPADPTGINEDNDYSPTGYIYYSGTGSLVQGGSILVNCTHGAASIVSGRDGKEGYYQFAVTDIDSLANCELSYTPPAGYRFDESCASGAAPSVCPPMPALRSWVRRRMQRPVSSKTRPVAVIPGISVSLSHRIPES